jgi:hypothetical protein
MLGLLQAAVINWLLQGLDATVHNWTWKLDQSRVVLSAAVRHRLLACVRVSLVPVRWNMLIKLEPR